jgi:hypothetical protein
MTPFDEIPFPTGKTPETWRVADWVELRALSSRVSFKRGDLSSPDMLEESVWTELALRSDLFGARWPFEFSADAIGLSRGGAGPLSLYRYLCLLGLGEVVESEDRQRFEELIVHLAPPLVGGPLVRVGHPASPGQPSSFNERMANYWTLPPR